jgi:hypothetical protein
MVLQCLYMLIGHYHGLVLVQLAARQRTASAESMCVALGDCYSQCVPSGFRQDDSRWSQPTRWAGHATLPPHSTVLIFDNGSMVDGSVRYDNECTCMQRAYCRHGESYNICAPQPCSVRLSALETVPGLSLTRSSLISTWLPKPCTVRPIAG